MARISFSYEQDRSGEVDQFLTDNPQAWRQNWPDEIIVLTGDDAAPYYDTPPAAPE